MSRDYVHDLNKEVRSISGYYSFQREERLAHRGKDYLYLVGVGVVETSCCGVGGCAYALVTGEVVDWKARTNEEGLSVSRVEPVADPALQKELAGIINEKETVSQVQFW
jgi:hypothetical protein